MNDFLHDISWVIPYRSDLLTPLFEMFTKMGYPTFMMFFMALGYWLWNKNIFTRLAVIVMASAILNAFLKDLWQNPRPDVLFRLDPGIEESFGMPSGHAQVSAVLWIWLAYELRRSWAWIVAIVIVAGIAFSRIYLGVHDVEDILAGFSLAAAGMLLYRWMLSEQFAKFRAQSIWLHLALIFILQIVLYYTWPGYGHSINAIALANYIMAWLLGVYIEKKYINFELRSEGWVLPAATVIGVMGLFMFTELIRAVLTDLDPLLVRCLRAFSVGLFVTAAIPMVYKLVGLQKRPA